MSKKKKSFLGIISSPNIKSIKSKKGIAIIAVILLACFFLFFSSSPTSSKSSSLYFEEEMETDEYAADLEARLEKIISSVSNTGKTEVMITLDKSVEYEYQSDIKDSATTDVQNEGISKEERDKEETTVTVKNSSGEEIPVLKSKSSPRIGGVLVICEGGGRADVKENISKAVKALLGIPSNKICVLKKN